MANVLKKEKQGQVLALGRLGWALRRIEKATGVRRETAAAYLRAAGIGVRPSGKWGRAPLNPANEVTAESQQELAQSEKSFSAPFRDFIEEQLARGRNAFGIYQQLVDQNGFSASYESVKRFVRTLGKNVQPQAHPVIETAPPSLRGVNIQRLFGSQRALKSVEDFTEFELKCAIDSAPRSVGQGGQCTWGLSRG